MWDLKALALVFASVFVAELGDKTQLATMLFAADRQIGRWTVFLGASLALVLAAGLAVLAGDLVSRYLSERILRLLAGVGFLAIGAWTLWRA